MIIIIYKKYYRKRIYYTIHIRLFKYYMRFLYIFCFFSEFLKYIYIYIYKNMDKNFESAYSFEANSPSLKMIDIEEKYSIPIKTKK